MVVTRSGKNVPGASGESIYQRDPSICMGDPYGIHLFLA